MPSKANFLAEGSIFRGEKVGGVCSKSWGSTQKLCTEARDTGVKLVENILWHFQQKETRESFPWWKQPNYCWAFTGQMEFGSEKKIQKPLPTPIFGVTGRGFDGAFEFKPGWHTDTISGLKNFKRRSNEPKKFAAARARSAGSCADRNK